jgi:hypothetical protein
MPRWDVALWLRLIALFKFWGALELKKLDDFVLMKMACECCYVCEVFQKEGMDVEAVPK